MSEFRQNLATKEWVVIASERAKRPQELVASAPPVKDDGVQCPFCPGRESLSGQPSYSLGSGSDWKVRVFPNKYPALVSQPASCPRHPLYRSLPGAGVHEVIVETPRHDADLASAPQEQVRDVLGVYRRRFSDLLGPGGSAMTMIFKNHGAGAGASLSHPHSQLVGSSVVPSNIRHRMDEAMKYYESTGTCVFCRMLQQELKDGARMVEETEHFAAFVLYAALSPFHIWVMPKRHVPSFAETNDKELENLARVLSRLLKRVHKGLGDPAYNYVIQSTPLDRGATDSFHWYLSLVVRVSSTAGFELGSGIHINPVPPEESARFLQSVKV